MEVPNVLDLEVRVAKGRRILGNKINTGGLSSRGLAALGPFGVEACGLTTKVEAEDELLVGKVLVDVAL